MSDGQLTAITQYNADVLLRDLTSDSVQRVALQRSIEDKVREVGPLISQRSYVVDVITLTPASSGHPREVRVIELNPFLHTTGAALFDWHRDRDVLRNGHLQFRLLRKRPTPSELYKLVPPLWRKRLGWNVASTRVASAAPATRKNQCHIL